MVLGLALLCLVLFAVVLVQRRSDNNSAAVGLPNKRKDGHDSGGDCNDEAHEGERKRRGDERRGVEIVNLYPAREVDWRASRARQAHVFRMLWRTILPPAKQVASLIQRVSFFPDLGPTSKICAVHRDGRSVYRVRELSYTVLVVRGGVFETALP